MFITHFFDQRDFTANKYGKRAGPKKFRQLFSQRRQLSVPANLFHAAGDDRKRLGLVPVFYFRNLPDSIFCRDRSAKNIKYFRSSLALEAEGGSRTTALPHEAGKLPATSELRDLISKLHGSVLELKDAILSGSLEDWDEEDGEDEEDGRAIPDFASITCPFCGCSFYRSGAEGADDEVLCPECGRAIRGRADIDA